MHDRRSYVLAVPAAGLLLFALTACQASGTSSASPAARDMSRERVAPAASDRTRGDVPAGSTTGQPSGSGTTEGPHEGTRGSMPPGMTLDGLPPVGGAIVDPSGAVTGTPPPPGMR